MKHLGINQNTKAIGKHYCQGSISLPYVGLAKDNNEVSYLPYEHKWAKFDITETGQTPFNDLRNIKKLVVDGEVIFDGQYEFETREFDVTADDFVEMIQASGFTRADYVINNVVQSYVISSDEDILDDYFIGTAGIMPGYYYSSFGFVFNRKISDVLIQRIDSKTIEINLFDVVGVYYGHENPMKTELFNGTCIFISKISRDYLIQDNVLDNILNCHHKILYPKRELYQMNYIPSNVSFNEETSEVLMDDRLFFSPISCASLVFTFNTSIDTSNTLLLLCNNEMSLAEGLPLSDFINAGYARMDGYALSLNLPSFISTSLPKVGLIFGPLDEFNNNISQWLPSTYEYSINALVTKQASPYFFELGEHTIQFEEYMKVPEWHYFDDSRDGVDLLGINDLNLNNVTEFSEDCYKNMVYMQKWFSREGMNTSKLKKLFIPKEMIYTETTAIYYNYGLPVTMVKDNLESIIVSNENTYFDSRNDCNAIIATQDNILVIGCKNTIIPDSVTSIGNSAFSKCSGLTSINIPDSVTKIGDSAFSGCTSLPIENNLRYADTYLVGAVDKTQTSYTIKEGTKWIGNSAFSNCSGLTSINMSDSVTTIGKWAFSYCSGLTSIVIPDSVTSIGERAFSYCTSLTSITLGKSVTSIGDDALSYCSSLTSITFHNSLATSPTYATFYGLPKNGTIYYPQSESAWFQSLKKDSHLKNWTFIEF